MADNAPYLDPKFQAEALATFLEEHVRAYDPENDDYDQPPFAADIKEGKNDPIYNVHSYHTKVPPRSIVPYILHYTQPGDVVLDPFCGSGMTGVAAQMCADPPTDILAAFPELKARIGARACILNDLSPAACHIAYNYNTPVDVEALKLEFDRIKEAVKEEFDWLYGTEHYEPAIGRHDLTNAAVESRLKNPPNGISKHKLIEEEERTWELLTKTEVEERLGYAVTELPRDEKWRDHDVAKIENWICIPATMQYTIWSDVYPCEGFVTVEEPTGRVSTRGKNAGKAILSKKRVARGCGQPIVLWDVAVDPTTKDFSERFKCPHCGQEWHKLLLTLKDTIPVWASYTFGSLSSPRARYDRRISKIEAERITTIQARGLHAEFPRIDIDQGRELMTMGPTNRGMNCLADFYTPRNGWGLGVLWKEISESLQSVQPVLRFAFTAILDVASRRNRFPQQAVMSSTLYVPSIQIEMNVLSQLSRRVEKIAKAEESSSYAKSGANSGVLVTLNDARTLRGICDSSIDYVFTDPPFGGNIYYADASILFEAWLGNLTDEPKELVFNRQRRQDQHFKSVDDYSNGMRDAFREMFRVLKPGRWATVEFSNSDGAVFNAIKEAVREAGFEIVNMLLLDKTQKSFKQVKGATGEEDVVDKDVLFNLLKPAIVHAEFATENYDFDRQVAEAVRYHLQTLPERIKTEPAKYNDAHRSTATIHITLMNALIPRGVSVERLNLPFIERVCARYFRKVGQHWYLRGESVGPGNGNSLIDEEIDVQDEVTAIAWLRQTVEQKPLLIGELKPLWMRATGLLPVSVSQELSLEMLLSENFWRDPDTNRWREPTDEERERMNDDRSIRVIHDAERYIAGTLHRGTSDEERCNWIEVLFKACRQLEDGDVQSVAALRGINTDEAYRLITRLFQSVLRENVPGDVFTRAEKQAGVASNRISQSVRADDELRKAQVAKSKGPSLFDGIE